MRDHLSSATAGEQSAGKPRYHVPRTGTWDIICLIFFLLPRIDEERFSIDCTVLTTPTSFSSLIRTGVNDVELVDLIENFKKYTDLIKRVDQEIDGWPTPFPSCDTIETACSYQPTIFLRHFFCFIVSQHFLLHGFKIIFLVKERSERCCRGDTRTITKPFGVETLKGKESRKRERERGSFKCGYAGAGSARSFD